MHISANRPLIEHYLSRDIAFHSVPPAPNRGAVAPISVEFDKDKHQWVIRKRLLKEEGDEWGVYAVVDAGQ